MTLSKYGADVSSVEITTRIGDISRSLKVEGVDLNWVDIVRDFELASRIDTCEGDKEVAKLLRQMGIK